MPCGDSVPCGHDIRKYAGIKCFAMAILSTTRIVDMALYDLMSQSAHASVSAPLRVDIFGIFSFQGAKENAARKTWSAADSCLRYSAVQLEAASAMPRGYYRTYVLISQEEKVGKGSDNQGSGDQG